MKTISYILLTLALALIVAWSFGVFEGTKLPIGPVDFSPKYETPNYEDGEGKG